MRNRTFLIAAIAVLACGLIAAGCGGDDETTSTDAASALEDASTSAETTVPGDVSIPEDAQEALDNAPANVDEAVQQCLDSAENSGLSSEQVDNLKQLCESGRDAANQALENAKDLQDEFGN